MLLLGGKRSLIAGGLLHTLPRFVRRKADRHLKKAVFRDQRQASQAATRSTGCQNAPGSPMSVFQAQNGGCKVLCVCA
jgi:hypothetical protein